jgi:hypothetical protein
MFAPTTTSEATASAGAQVLADPWLTPEQVAAELPNVSVRQVRGWISRGLLEGSNPARGVWLVRRSALEAWLDAGQPRRIKTERPRREPPARLEPQRDRMPRASRRRLASNDLDLSIPGR